MSGEKLRALAEAATPGPWVQEGANYDRPSRNVRAQHQDGWPLQGVAYNIGRTADSAFIAAANPTAVLALLDEVERLRADIVEAEQRGREDNEIHSCCYVSGSKALEAILDERDALRAVVIGKVRHRYMGQCPDELDGFNLRDLECPACDALDPQ